MRATRDHTGDPALRIAPTLRGDAVAVTGVACAAGGWWLGYPELYAIAGACLAALLVAGLWFAGGTRLAVTRDVAPARVARGGDAVGTVRVVNLGRRPTRALTAVDRVGSEAVRVEVPPLGRRAANTVGYRLPTGRRGELTVGPLLIRADDPFGLLRRVLVHGRDATVLVRPRTAPLAGMPAGRRASLEGPTAENAPAGTAAFHTLREYVPGDDLRHVHWRTTARAGTLMVRHLVDSALPETAIVLDTRAGSYSGAEDFDIAVDAAATIAAGMAADGFPVVVHTTGGERFRARGARAVPALLDQLAVLRLDSGTGPDGGQAAVRRAIQAARRGASARSGLALIAGALGDVPARPVTAARGYFDRVVLMRAGAGEAGRIGGMPVVPVARAEDAAAAWRGGRG